LFQNFKARADFIGAAVAVYEALPYFVKRFCAAVSAAFVKLK